VRPFSEFSGKLQSFMKALGGGLAGGATSGTGASSSSGAGAANAAGVQSYSKCIQAAGNDVGKMQQCSALLSSG
jgi:predicted lipid-binding transport protein (Tim44 family)